VLVFHSLLAALKAGYMVDTPTPTGYIVRIHTSQGWMRALVEIV
jgi:hypothetical protein